MCIRDSSSIERIIANTEKEYEILAIVGTINPDSEAYPFISVSLSLIHI